MCDLVWQVLGVCLLPVSQQHIVVSTFVRTFFALVGLSFVWTVMCCFSVDELAKVFSQCSQGTFSFALSFLIAASLEN